MPARVLPVEPEAEVLPGVNIQLGCRRGLDDTQCEARCCHCCDHEERLSGLELCGECAQSMADMRRDDEACR